ncbi:MAG: hypothetical protein QM602_05620 [Microbacterium sp.]
MLVVLALIFGAAIGAAIHFSLPHRDTRGAALAPMVGAVVGGAVWLLFTWLGLQDTGWVWLASLAAPIVVTWPLVAILALLRVAHDARERERLGIA